MLQCDDARLARLDAPTACADFPRSGVLSRAPPLAAPLLPSSNAAASASGPPLGPPSLSEAQQAAVGKAIKAMAEAVVAAEPILTEWDTKVGDGDCGDTLMAGAKAMLEDLPSYPLGHPQPLLQAVARSLARSMGGSSGALYSIFLNGAAAALAPGGVEQAAAAPSAAEQAAAFKAGNDAISKYGGAGAGDRTMLDSLIPAAAAAAAAAGGTVAAMLAAAATAGEAGVEATMGMGAEAGRSSYVPVEVLRTVPDPGAKGVAVWLRALADSSA